LSDDPNGDTEQSNGGQAEAPPQASSDAENRPVNRPDTKRQTNTAEDSGKDRKRGPLQFLQRLTVNEWLTFLVGFGGLVVSGLTFMNAADTADLKSAITNLNRLAGQTKRMADAQNGQLGLLREQVEEVKAQTKAISEEAEAVKRGATSSIRLADAQLAATRFDQTIKRPRITIDTISLDGFKSDASLLTKKVTVKMSYRFTNAGGASLTLRGTHIGVYASDGTSPKGTATIVNVNGNELIIGPGGEFHNTKPLELYVDKVAADNVNQGLWRVFVFGSNEYVGPDNVTHSKCFAYIVPIKDGVSDGYVAYPDPTYNCDN
jgi:hypothetical protein